MKTQRYQSKVLKATVDAVWFVPNRVLPSDIQIATDIEVCVQLSVRYLNRLSDHPNEPATNLLINESRKRLKRYAPLDLPQ